MSSTNIDKSLQLFKKEILESSRKSYNVQLKLYDILIPGLAVFIIFINLMIVFSSGLILKRRQQPRSTYIFLGNIALADMMAGISTLFGQYYPKDKRSELVCTSQIGLIISAILASVYSIALIAIDRYLYILYGLQYQRYLSTKRARLMSIGTWIIGGLVGFLPTMGIRNNVKHNPQICWLILIEPKGLLLFTVAIGMIPLVVVIILYSIILKRALGKISEMKESTISAKVSSNSNPIQLRYFRGGGNAAKNTTVIQKTEHIVINEEVPVRKNFLFKLFRRSKSANISSVYSPSRWKAIKIVLFTTGCFFVTWFPYFFACALFAFCENTKLSCNGLRIAIASPLAILGFSNSLLNPLIYAWWHNGFRESVKSLYNRMWQHCTGSKPDLPSKSKQIITNSSSSTHCNSAGTESSDVNEICHL